MSHPQHHPQHTPAETVTVSKDSKNRAWLKILAIALILGVAGGGYVAWQVRNHSKAHAAAYGSVIGAWSGASAYACREAGSVRITVFRNNPVVVDTNAVITSSDGNFVNGQTNSNWQNNVQSYTVNYSAGAGQLLSAGFNPSNQNVSMVNAYNGRLVQPSGAWSGLSKLPAVDGLSTCP